MSNKKHIDRLFQETFKDFEETPNNAVWDRIEAQLKEKKKRRVIPIWWRYAGVAALFLLLLTIGNIYFNNDSSTTPMQVVDSEENNASKKSNENSATDSNHSIENTNVIANDHSLENGQENSSEDKVLENNADKLIHQNKASIAKNPSKKDVKENAPNSRNSQKETQQNNAFQTKNNSENNLTIANHSEENNNNNPSKTNQTAELDKNKADNIINTIKKSNNAEAIAKTDATEERKTEEVPEKKALTIEEVLEKAKNIDEEEKVHLNRWSVAPNAAPVFFNSLGKGSSIDSQFNNNSKSSETNMSYGITASYAVSKKLSVRSGVNKVNLGYNTNDVVAFQSVGGGSSISFLKNVKPELGNANNDISVLSSQNFANKSSESFATATGVNTAINQSLSYIEIPLEIKYMLTDKKLGIDVIGGFSSFFLNGNELYSEFEGNRTNIGEANNINKTSYSANFGFGLNYKIAKKVNLNLEPMFKYQINTFNNTSGDFKPYFIGVYTGFGFKF